MHRISETIMKSGINFFIQGQNIKLLQFPDHLEKIWPWSAMSDTDTCFIYIYMESQSPMQSCRSFLICVGLWSTYSDLICLFGVFRPTEEFFTHKETSQSPGEGLQILTQTRHSWPLSSEGSIACHIYCDTGHYIWWPVTLTSIAERLAVELSLPVFTT